MTKVLVGAGEVEVEEVQVVVVAQLMEVGEVEEEVLGGLEELEDCDIATFLCISVHILVVLMMDGQ